MPLSAVAVSNAKSRAKPYKLSDERGLYLLGAPKGQRYWRFKFRFDDKEKTPAFGVYSDVSLADAREKRDAARRSSQRDMIRPLSGSRTRPRSRRRNSSRCFEQSRRAAATRRPTAYAVPSAQSSATRSLRGALSAMWPST
ncbi:MAG TPA: Arm DNA-binding domain-containing protein [Allosphingosinicella sp.]